MLVAGLSQSQHAQSRPTTLRQTIEASYPEGINFSFGTYSRQSKEESSPDRQMQLMKEQPLPGYQRKEYAIEGCICQMQCELGWDLKHQAQRGNHTYWKL